MSSSPEAVTAAVVSSTDAERTSMDGRGAASSAAATTPGAVLGRYIVIEELGRGAMGVVVRAYDPRLQREVAVKALRPRFVSAEDHARIVREARALAKLAHPNVVAVYDVEPDDRGGVIVAMEYVRGATLDRWLKSPRDTAAIVGVLIDVAHGLEAAHAAGLLHRDVKPSNVIVGDDGRARILDFGLARGGSTVVSADEPVAAPAPSALEVGTDTPLTIEGTVMGTPGFMAVEQHLGEVLTPAADQFGFCAMAWLALVGKHPFSADDYTALVEAKRAGPGPWPRTPGVSTALGEALRRGLAPDPQARWPSMAELVHELRRELAPSRRSPTVWVAALVGAAAIASVAWLGTRSDERCSGSASALDGTWDGEVRARAETALLGTGVSFATATWDAIRPRIDAWAQAWIDMHHETCVATTIRGEQSAALMDLRMACLRRASLELSAISGVLATADAETVARAEDLVGRLPSLDRCADIESLQAEVTPPDAELAGAIEQARGRLAEAAALRVAGKVRKSAAITEELVAGLEAVPYEPLHAEAQLELGLTHDEGGRYLAARDAMREALRLGLRQRQLSLATDAAIALVRIAGDRLDDYPSAHVYAELARGLLGPAPDPRHEAALHRALSLLAMSEPDLELAEAEARASLALLEASVGAEADETLAARTDLALALKLRGRLAEAEQLQRELLADRVRLQGPDHPNVANDRTNLASLLALQERLDEADVEYAASLEIRERVLGHDHPSTCVTRMDRAVHRMASAPAEAEVELRAVLVALERGLGPTHARVGALHANLGNLLRKLGRLADAEAELRKSTAIFTELMGPKHMMVGSVKFSLGGLLLQRERYPDAVLELRDTYEIWHAHFEPSDPRLGYVTSSLASALEKSGDAVAALPLAERSWQGVAGQPGIARAEPAFVLAKVLWALGNDRPRARELARTALADYEAAGATKQKDAVAAWLHEHR